MEEHFENNNENQKGPSDNIPVIRKAHKGINILIKIILYFILTIAVSFFLFCVPVYIAPELQTKWGIRRSACKPDESLLKDKSVKKKIAKLDSEIDRLNKKVVGLVPSKAYIVVNTVDNKFFLYNKGNLIRIGRCSTGKNTILTNSAGKIINKFKTPRGCFTILGKKENPVWTRPDWDYIEQGLPIPKPNDPSRFENGVLGDYAMTLGHGYMIHGTIYKRFLGLPVTHGCIRLNDEDLEVVYKNMSVGSKVFIY
jgi:hypothetical protein